MNMGRYVYPDWRHQMNWKKIVEYGPDASSTHLHCGKGSGKGRM